jgi:uroporphyrin-3 C-methyltransferase
LDSVNQSLAEERQTTTTRVDKLDEDLQGVSHRISVVASLLGRSERGWALAEIEYLLRIANQRLQLQGDVKTAQQAIKAADGRLRDLADPHYFSVREQLARDLEAVNAVPVVDMDGLSLALSTALAGVDKLPLAGAHYRPVQPGPEGDAGGSAPAARNLDELGRLVWTSVTDLFRLREHDRPVAPMLAPDREYFLRENMRLQLAAARLALLRNDRQQYRSTLDTAVGWLQQYFDKTDPSVQQLVGQLEDLAVVDISPEMPDVSRSLALLRQQMQLSEQPEVQPVVPEQDSRDDSEATSGEPGAAQ